MLISGIYGRARAVQGLVVLRGIRRPRGHIRCGRRCGEHNENAHQHSGIREGKIKI